MAEVTYESRRGSFAVCIARGDWNANQRLELGRGIVRKPDGFPHRLADRGAASSRSDRRATRRGRALNVHHWNAECAEACEASLRTTRIDGLLPAIYPFFVLT